MSSSSEDAKKAILAEIQQTSAMNNARALINSINERCYELCVPKPGTVLSNGESTCYTACMEKYMTAWNSVSRAYIQRIQTEAASQRQGFGALGTGGIGGMELN